MTVRGVVKNGVIVLRTSDLPDGTEVEVVPRKPKAASSAGARGKARKGGQDRSAARPASRSAKGSTRGSVKKATTSGLQRLAGIVKGLPADWSSQHDHYISDTPKRKR